jgi:hypothetical protein
MSIHKDKYTFKDKTWYIVPWKIIDPDTHDIHLLPSILVHDVDGYDPHRLVVWSYEELEENHAFCYNCWCRPSKKIQTLWTLENMDNPNFMERY